jgi:hypothetical protein
MASILIPDSGSDYGYDFTAEEELLLAQLVADLSQPDVTSTSLAGIPNPLAPNLGFAAIIEEELRLNNEDLPFVPDYADESSLQFGQSRALDNPTHSRATMPGRAETAPPALPQPRNRPPTTSNCRIPPHASFVPPRSTD